VFYCYSICNSKKQIDKGKGLMIKGGMKRKIGLRLEMKANSKENE
jgi:hypothetical protein